MEGCYLLKHENLVVRQDDTIKRKVFFFTPTYFHVKNFVFLFLRRIRNT